MTLRWILMAALLLGCGAIVLALTAPAPGVPEWQLAARWTARVSVIFFLPVYAASSLATLWPRPETRALLRSRRNLGLGFAMAHTVHLYALIRQLLAAEGFHPEELIGGIVIYALIFAMAVTSFPWAYRALGRKWKRLHTLGIHAIWVAFFSAYSGRIFEPEARAVGLIFSSLLIAGLLLRIMAWSRKRSAGKRV